MERGTELSQTVATFIIQKILSDASGLSYICQTKQRFFTVISVMDTMVKAQKSQPSQRLLKHIARCYQKLFENQRAKEYLAEQIPTILNDRSLEAHFDENTKQIVAGMREIIKNWALETGMNNAPIRMMPGHQQRMAGMMNASPGPFNMNPMGKQMGHPMTGMVQGIDKNSGRNSTELRQPILSRPSSTNYVYNPAMFKMGAHKAFVPATQSNHPFSRPGSSQAHISPLESQMGGHSGLPAQSPPIQQPTQPVMMSYVHYNMPQTVEHPDTSSHPHMMRMSQNQSPYHMYPMMHSHTMPDHSASMASPGIYPSQIYMQPNMSNLGYRMPPPQRNTK